MTIYRCKHCGNTAVLLHNSGVKMHCCGEEMGALEAGVIDAALEKHVPVIKRKDENRLKVKVGEAEHPMTPEHHIAWIMLETAHGFQFNKLEQDGKPKAKFRWHRKNPPVAAYEYCNLHGLWKKEGPFEVEE